jgi:trimeric autotransporter adhesin
MQMKRNGYLITVFVGMALALGAVGGARAQSDGPSPQEGVGVQAVLGTGFTYQGQLKSSGSPVNGSCTFGFGLWNASSGGAQLGITQTVTTTVNNGLFTVLLNDSGQFGGSAFTGDARYLGSGVKCGSESSLTSLGRQTLTAAPYALYARNNWGLNGNSGTSASNFLGTTDNMTLTLAVNNSAALRLVPNATSPNLIGGYSGNSVSAGISGATIGGGGASGLANTVTGFYGMVGGGFANSAGATGATVGGGVGNTASGISATTVGGGANNTASIEYSTVGGGLNNTASASGATVSGGLNNTVSGVNATVSGGYTNTVIGDYATVGGGDTNFAGADYATVGGGYDNTVSGFAATVGGGQSNIASDIVATVGGGLVNTASGNTATVGGGYDNTASNDYATVGGGVENTASGFAATVGGGQSNIASDTVATVGGGLVNTASGYAATVSGGYGNIASGEYSFAAGQFASALHDGAFVWADASTTDPITSTIDNQFLVRASGGITLYTDFGATTGAVLQPGSGTWSSASDRALKANFVSVDGVAILKQLSLIPIQTWNYQAQDVSIRHIGPMAQDFYTTFNVGEDNTHITTVDADGVALAAIQGLYQVVQAKEAKITELETRIVALEQQSKSPSDARNSASPISLGWLLFGGLLLLNLGFIAGRGWNAKNGGAA